MKGNRIKRVLIANRGEIAVRIIRACREMGITSVAICSDIDKEAMHAQLADECICIGSYKLKDSYLNMERILSAAIAADVDAIHPGFGFLSENSKFVKMCQECNFTFIGPSMESMEQMGNKSEARRVMKNAGVPIIPGGDTPYLDAMEAKQEAAKMGYPVIIKAVSGGGGKGMRVVEKEEDFLDLFLTAQKESENAFGDRSMYLEKYLANCRHIEVQILADQYGNVVHLGERDCSIQRKHQKVIEETPSIAVSDELRKKMGETAIKAAKAANYYSAGTIEFLLDKDNNFYFMEMNTRIQVEHPVTEEVTGIDIVKEMIRIAEGKKLGFTQEDIKITGHAIECRINAESPEQNFIPCPGVIESLHMPGGNGIRVDSAAYQGYKIPSCYDSMIAKLIVHGENRNVAIQKLRSALSEMIIEGVKTNVGFQYRLVGEEAFKRGDVNWINQNYFS
ncbi:acetyl-CoA carboxylase [Clostridium sp. CAG:411]|nr:acetyl-CoA carboxylase biotin carboxylase subunit [Lachnospiraceae bacterium]CDE44681.1 acetyl-CoA carboxylase [Clostridium sp. CAG:411]